MNNIIIIVFNISIVLFMLLIDDILISILLNINTIRSKLRTINNNFTIKIKKHFKDDSVIIGYMERLIILYFLYKGAYPAVGIIVTAKAILRHNDNSNHNIKIVKGTMLSLILAIFNYELIMYYHLLIK